MNDPIITVEHARQAGLCVRGAKQWFALHGLDFQRFLREGYRVSEVAHLGDAMADKLIAIVREEES